MRRWAWTALGAVVCAVCLPGAAGAGVLAYRGTLSLEMVAGEDVLPAIDLPGSGVATVNGSGGGGHLDALHLDTALQTTNTLVVPITDPEVVAQGIVSLRATRSPRARASRSPSSTSAPAPTWSAMRGAAEASSP